MFYLTYLFSWSIAVSQSCVSLCCATTWSSTRIHQSLLLSLPRTPHLGSSAERGSRPRCCAADFGWPSSSHTGVWSVSAALSPPLLHHPMSTAFSTSCSVPALQRGLSGPFFSRFRIYALIYSICNSLSDLLHSVDDSSYIRCYFSKCLFSSV